MRGEVDLINTLKSNWKCSHTIDGRPITTSGWCSRCGCARDDYTTTLERGDTIISALNGFIFEHNGRLIWYKDALYQLELIPKPEPEEEQWQSIEVAEGGNNG